MTFGSRCFYLINQTFKIFLLTVIVFYRFATVAAPIQKHNLFKGDSILCQYQLYVYYILCEWYFMLMTEICILLSYVALSCGC